MKDRKAFETLFRKAPFRSNADVDRAVLNALLGQWNRSIDRPAQKGGLGRHIMRSTTGKLVAAGIVLALVVTGLIHWGDHGGGVALGDVLESMRHVPWIHVTATVEAPGGSGVIQQWDSYDHSITIMVDVEGVITYRNYNAATMHVYQPRTHTVTISPTTDKFNLPSPAAAIEALIASEEAAGAQVTYEDTVHEGVAVRRVHVVREHEDVTLLCDKSSGLPLTMETVAVLPGKATPARASAVFDYPAEGPADIYSLGVPPDARVIDNRPTGDAADLVEQVQTHFDAGFEDHVAVMLESYVDTNEVLEPAHVYVMWQEKPRKRLSSYSAYHFTGSKSDWPTLYPLIKDTWADLTLSDVLALISDDVAENQWIFDGTASINRSNFSGKVNVQTIRTDIFQSGNLQSLAGLSRPNPSALLMTGSDTQKKLEVLPADANRPGLVGFQIVTTPSDPDGRLPGTTTQAEIVSYWFDPGKDYLLMEQSTHSERNEGMSEFVRRTIETAQTAAGRWYPALIQTTSSYPDFNGQIHRTTRQQRILLDPSPVFEEKTFDAAALRDDQTSDR